MLVTLKIIIKLKSIKVKFIEFIYNNIFTKKIIFHVY